MRSFERVEREDLSVCQDDGRRRREEQTLLVSSGETGLPLDRESDMRPEVDGLLSTLGGVNERCSRDRIEEHRAERCRHERSIGLDGEYGAHMGGRADGRDLRGRGVGRQHHRPPPIARRERDHRRRPRWQEERAPPPGEHPDERRAPLEEGESRRYELRGGEIVDAAAGGGEAEGEGVHALNDNVSALGSSCRGEPRIFRGCLPILV